MIPPFNRRDSAACIGSVGLLAFLLTLAVASQGLGWGQGLALAAAAAVVTVLVLASLFWRMPPDVPLRTVSAAVAEQARAEPPSGIARLRVALRPEPLGWYRLDIMLDGVRIGQLRPGTAFVLPVVPGAHILTARVWLRTLRTRELINALPGTDTDIVVQGRGERSRQYSFDRHGMTAVLVDRRITLIEPLTPDAPGTRTNASVRVR